MAFVTSDGTYIVTEETYRDVEQAKELGHMIGNLWPAEIAALGLDHTKPIQAAINLLSYLRGHVVDGSGPPPFMPAPLPDPAPVFAPVAMRAVKKVTCQPKIVLESEEELARSLGLSQDSSAAKPTVILDPNGPQSDYNPSGRR